MDLVRMAAIWFAAVYVARIVTENIWHTVSVLALMFLMHMIGFYRGLDLRNKRNREMMRRD